MSLISLHSLLPQITWLANSICMSGKISSNTLSTGSRHFSNYAESHYGNWTIWKSFLYLNRAVSTFNNFHSFKRLLMGWNEWTQLKGILWSHSWLLPTVLSSFLLNRDSQHDSEWGECCFVIGKSQFTAEESFNKYLKFYIWQYEEILQEVETLKCTFPLSVALDLCVCVWHRGTSVWQGRE